jgi:hypothetical protein
MWFPGSRNRPPEPLTQLIADAFARADDAFPVHVLQTEVNKVLPSSGSVRELPTLLVEVTLPSRFDHANALPALYIAESICGWLRSCRQGYVPNMTQYVAMARLQTLRVALLVNGVPRSLTVDLSTYRVIDGTGGGLQYKGSRLATGYGID